MVSLRVWQNLWRRDFPLHVLLLSRFWTLMLVIAYLYLISFLPLSQNLHVTVPVAEKTRFV